MHEIPTALATIQTVKNLVKSVIDSKTASALREQAIESQFAIMELQTTLLNMQSQYQSLLQEKDELKKQLAEIENWGTESAKYVLQDLGDGIFVYSQRPEYNALTPAHWLCTHCYENKQKSVLIRTGNDSKGIVFLCFRCQNSIRVGVLPGQPT
jgi:hypothetical protein